MEQAQHKQEEPRPVDDDQGTTVSRAQQNDEATPDPRSAAGPGLPSSRPAERAERPRPAVIDAVDESVLAMAHRVVDLAVHDIDDDYYIFVNRQGVKMRQVSRLELLKLIDNGLVDILETKSNFRDEVTEVRKNLDP